MGKQHKTVNNFLFCGKGVLVFSIIFGFFYSCAVLAAADTGGGIGSIASGIVTQFKALGQLILAIAFLAGIGFIMAAIFKFKQHKDNPTQITLGTPISMLVIGAVLVFLPSLINPVGVSIFGPTRQAGGFMGGGVSAVPGANS